MRNACVDSLASTLPVYARDNGAFISFQSFLRISTIVLRLVVDEDFQVRKSMSHILAKCSLIPSSFSFKKGSELRPVDLFPNENVALGLFVSGASELFAKAIKGSEEPKRREISIEVVKWFLEKMFGHENMFYKSDAHHSNKIFNLDKPNKYMDDIQIKLLCLKELQGLKRKEGLIEENDLRKLVEGEEEKQQKRLVCGEFCTKNSVLDYDEVESFHFESMLKEERGIGERIVDIRKRNE